MRVATHPGNFHADDVFAIAVLGLVHGSLDVVRTRDAAAQDAADLRVDVGGRSDPATGDFDHHQKGGAGERPNGIRYASLGLVWRAHGEALAGGPEAAAAIDERIVQGIDANDTGQTIAQALIDDVRPMSVSGIVAAMNPVWDEHLDPAEEDARFAEAVAMATRILERELAGAAAFARAQQLVRDAIGRASDPRIIELDRNMPWRETVVTQAPEALYVMYPKSDGWGMQAVPRGARHVRQPPRPPGRMGRPVRRGAGRGQRRPRRRVLPHGPLLRLGRQPRGHHRARPARAGRPRDNGGRTRGSAPG